MEQTVQEHRKLTRPHEGATTMQQLKVMHICTGCGKRKKLNPNKRQWCDCNPSAKFKMMVESDYRLAHAMVAGFVSGAKKLAG